MNKAMAFSQILKILLALIIFTLVVVLAITLRDQITQSSDNIDDASINELNDVTKDFEEAISSKFIARRFLT